MEIYDSDQDIFETPATSYSQKSTQPPSPILVSDEELQPIILSEYDSEDEIIIPPSPVFKKKCLRHAFISNDKKLVPGFPNWFNVKYSGDRAIYTYELMKEYQRGDLKLVV